jgi:undecaprenyl-diphosphatase
MLALFSDWRFLLLALVQGLSEIFPVSSSGHLVVLSRVLQVPISFDLIVFFHIGTFLAILVKYRVQVWRLLSGKLGWKLLFYMSLSFLTTALVGLGVKSISDRIVSGQAGTLTILWMVNGAILVLIGLYSPQGKRRLPELKLKEFILIGLVQGLTALPGISRLGMTLGAGLLLSLVWFEALDLSFLLSLPTIFFANVFTLLGPSHGTTWPPAAFPWGAYPLDFGGGFVHNQALILAAGLIITFASGLVSIRILYKYLSKKLLVFFGLYCILAGIFFTFLLKLL